MNKYFLNNANSMFLAPIMIAKDYADRGARMYKSCGGRTVDELDTLRYYTSKFKDYRINA